MPGAAYWGSSASAYAGTLITFVTPTYAKVGDVVLGVIVAPSSAAIATPDGWDLMGAVAVAGTVNMKAWLFRRVVADLEPATHAFTTAAALSPSPVGLALLYRYAHPTAALAGSAANLFNSATVDYDAPDVVTAFGDVVLFAFYSKDPTGTNDVDPSPSKRGATVHGTTGGGSLAVLDLRSEVAGSPGVIGVGWSAPATGIAATFAFASTTIPQVVTVPYDIPGAIGLVPVGI